MKQVLQFLFAVTVALASTAPTASPTDSPTTGAPTLSPTASPTASPTTGAPTLSPTLSPTNSPTESLDTNDGVLIALKNETDLSTFTRNVLANDDVYRALRKPKKRKRGSLFVFAPTDAALKAVNVSTIPGDALKYHIAKYTDKVELVEGLNIIPSIDGSQVLKVTKTGEAVSVASGVPSVTAPASKTITTKNGIIYVIDKVLSAPGAFGTTAETLGLSTLLTLLNRTNLLSVVPTFNQTTIFAPSNAAFEAYLKQQGIADAASLNATDATKLLLEHVATSAIYSTDLFKLKNLTLGGKTWDISGQTIGGASVTNANVLLTNGVIHVIDRVLGGPGAATSSDGGLTGGEVVAIVVGVLAAVAIIGYCCFRSSKRSDDYQNI